MIVIPFLIILLFLDLFIASVFKLGGIGFLRGALFGAIVIVGGTCVALIFVFCAEWISLGSPEGALQFLLDRAT